MTEVGDYVYGPDANQWKVVAIGGKNKNVLHCERPIYRPFRDEDCRPAPPPKVLREGSQ